MLKRKTQGPSHVQEKAEGAEHQPSSPVICSRNWNTLELQSASLQFTSPIKYLCKVLRVSFPSLSSKLSPKLSWAHFNNFTLTRSRVLSRMYSHVEKCFHCVKEWQRSIGCQKYPESYQGDKYSLQRGERRLPRGKDMAAEPQTDPSLPHSKTVPSHFQSYAPC